METQNELFENEIEELAEAEASDLDDEKLGRSAAIISVCTIISRVTGFARTWSMAWALGATFLSSSYQVANNLPNMLYELVMGGMLTTAFLPVYMSLKKNAGKKKSEEYASNLMTLVVLALGILAVLCMVFPSVVIYTQSFYSDQQTMGTATLLFQFFAIQIVFYGASSILSGILNSNRDYIWGAIAPVFNNLIVIAAFIAYIIVVPYSEEVAIYIIAVGSPLGVFVQMAIQVPGLKRNGIRLKPHLSLKDPALRETAAIGLPALFITICGFITVSVSNAASYSFADNGPSVIAYSRLWFTFPYSFLAIPVATAMFTELSDMQAGGNTGGVVQGIIKGSSQIGFLMVPFAMFLIVYAEPLVTLYHIGAFTSEGIVQIAMYLAVMALALPFYGMNTYLQMAFSSIRKMKAFSVMTLLGSALQVAIVAAAVAIYDAGGPSNINWVAAGTIGAYLLGDVASFLYLRRIYAQDGFHIGPIAKSMLHAFLLGLLGCAIGIGVFNMLQLFFGPMGFSLVRALVYVLVSGVFSVVATFAPAIQLNLPEASFAINIWNKISSRFRRKH